MMRGFGLGRRAAGFAASCRLIARRIVRGIAIQIVRMTCRLTPVSYTHLLFSGYISKTLIHEGIVEYVHLLAGQGRTMGAGLYTLAEWVYLFSGGLTSAYMLKLYICLFWEKRPEGAQPGHRPYIHALSKLSLIHI